MRRADRHRRPGHGPRGGEEPRARWRSSPTRPGTPRCWTRWARAGSPWISAAPWRPRRSPVRPPTTRRWRPGSPAAYAPDELARDTGWPDVAGAPVAAGRCAPLRGEPAPARGPVRPAGRRPRAAGIAGAELLHGKAMSYNNYVDAAAARRAAFDFARALRGDHQAFQPVRHRHRRRPGRRPPQGARLRPGPAFGGVIAANAAGDGGAGPADRRGVHRGRGRAGLRARGPGASWPRARTCGCCAARPRPRRGRRVAQDRRRPACSRRRTGSTSPATTRRLGAGGRRPGHRRRAGRSRLRLAGLPLGEVQRDPDRLRRRQRRDRHGPGQPGRLVPAGGGAGRGPGRRARSRPATRTSRSPTGSRC